MLIIGGLTIKIPRKSKRSIRKRLLSPEVSPDIQPKSGLKLNRRNVSKVLMA